MDELGRQMKSSKKLIIFKEIERRTKQKLEKYWSQLKQNNVKSLISFNDDQLSVLKLKGSSYEDIQQAINLLFLLFKNLKQINFKIINIFSVRAPSILKQLSHIQYQQLIHLNLMNCQIQNIQAITWMGMEKLQRLYFMDNKITNFKPLQKTNFPNLRIFSIKQNLGRQCICSINLLRMKYDQNLYFQLKYQTDAVQKEFSVPEVKYQSLYQVSQTVDKCSRKFSTRWKQTLKSQNKYIIPCHSYKFYQLDVCFSDLSPQENYAYLFLRAKGFQFFTQDDFETMTLEKYSQLWN